jgi:hypothetical protein
MYFVNRYRQDMPFLKKVLEDLRYRIRWFLNYYKNKTIRTALFYPHFPSKSTVLYKIFRSLNYNITNNPAKTRSLIIYWDDTTYRKVIDLPEQTGSRQKIVNHDCRDISKTHVDKVFSKIFGYSSLVESESYTGLIVKKNELNASHDGEIIQGPVNRREEGYVYQKLINNECDDQFVVDMRIPMINGIIPLVYVKHKSLETRFARFRRYHHRKKKVEVLMPEEIFSEDEINKLIAFCKSFNLDYGELDVLRDRDDGKIYIIDVNYTPYGPPYMPKKKKREILNILAQTFRREFLEPIR